MCIIASNPGSGQSRRLYQLPQTLLTTSILVNSRVFFELCGDFESIFWCYYVSLYITSKTYHDNTFRCFMETRSHLHKDMI